MPDARCAPPMSLTGRRSAADARRAHDKIVVVAHLRLRRALVDVALDEECVDAIRRVAAHPGEARALRVEHVVDPQVEAAVGLTGIIEPHVRFDAVPAAGALAEHGSLSLRRTEPPE